MLKLRIRQGLAETVAATITANQQPQRRTGMPAEIHSTGISPIRHLAVNR